jgi:hypothetical protein
MGRKKTEIVSKTKITTMEEIMELASDHKVSFAKVSWGTGKGPYIVAFPDSCTRNYCEMNAYDFKSINIKDIKSDTLPLWECGARTPEAINKLPKLNLKEQTKKFEKEKLARKELKAKKLK